MRTYVFGGGLWGKEKKIEKIRPHQLNLHCNPQETNCILQAYHEHSNEIRADKSMWSWSHTKKDVTRKNTVWLNLQILLFFTTLYFMLTIQSSLTKFSESVFEVVRHSSKKDHSFTTSWWAQFPKITEVLQNTNFYNENTWFPSK